MGNERLVEWFRGAAEKSDCAPEGLEFFDWWWLPYGTYGRVPLPYEVQPLSITDGYLPPIEHCFPEVVIRPTLHFFVHMPDYQPASVGWDARTRQAAVFFGYGHGRLPRRPPTAPAEIDRLAEQGSAFVEAEREKQFRAMLKSLVEQLAEASGEWGISWEEQERIRELRERTEDW